MHNSENRRAEGFSLIELLVAVAIIMTIMGMAIPRIQATKVQALEAGAIKAITTIHIAQAQYQSQNGRFALTLAELGPPPSGGPSVSAAGLINPGLASGEKGGYKYDLQATESGYTINANPISFNSTGKHTYYSDESLVIRQNSTMEPATAASPEINPR
jgi:prepilin-type N-terminal cleavage/methylation domain-containing protein